MAVSNSNDFSLVRNEIIDEALIEIGVKTLNQVPSAEEVNRANTKLNALIKSWELGDEYVWKRAEGSLFVNTTTNKYVIDGSTAHATESYNQTTTTSSASSGANSIVVADNTGFVNNYNIGIVQDDGSLFWTTISNVSSNTITITNALTSNVASGNKVYVYQTKITKPKNISLARKFMTATGDETPLNMLDHDTYRNLTNKTTAGTPSQFFYEERLNAGDFYLYQQPDSSINYIINFSFEKFIFDFDNPTDDADFPKTWIKALSLNLAYDLSRQYGKGDTFREMLKRDADNAFQKATGSQITNTSDYFQFYYDS